MTPPLLFNIFLALIESSLFQSSPRYFLDFLTLIESSLFRSSCDRYFLDSLPLIVRSSWGGLPNPPAIF